MFRDVYETLTMRLHDHAITDALLDFIDGRKVVAIMGGHSILRDHPTFQQVAQLSRELTRDGYLLASGGGPGAMEATHLGAWFAQRDEAELFDAVSMLSKAPRYNEKGPWLDATFEVVEKYPLTDRKACESLGIPTWLYGHEPPTYFALKIAKYFANSTREEGLLAIAKHGVVFAPGSAGTIQEIFQDACQNHYKTYKTFSPMIFLDEGYWKWKMPVYPTLAQIALGHDWGQLISISDSNAEIIKRIKDFKPKE